MNCIVIGKGRAGAARVRTIQESSACFLVRHMSGRDFHEPQSSEQILYFVCTENKKHYAMTKSLLEHGHHVAVEFPPCTTQEEWSCLESLAHKKNLILHCGLIGLYTEQHKHRKKWLLENAVEEIRVDFSGGLYRWVHEEVHANHIPQLAFGRIAALWDLVGPLEVTEVKLKQTAHSYTFILRATGRTGVDVILQECREQDMKRSTVWSLTGKGVSYSPLERRKEDLFGMDLDRILRRIPSDVSLSNIFAFLDHVHAMTYGKSV